MLVHVNNHDDSRLVPEREERGGILSQTWGQILSEILPNTGAVYLRSALNARLSAACDFWLMPCVHWQTRQDQYRAAEVFERILHVIQILFESDLLCDRCTVQTAAALRVNTVSAPSDISHTVDPHQSGAPVKLWGGSNWISKSSLRTSGENHWDKVIRLTWSLQLTLVSEGKPTVMKRITKLHLQHLQ